MDFETWMKENFDEPEWYEGYTRADMQKAYEASNKELLQQIEYWKAADERAHKVADYWYNEYEKLIRGGNK
jgi:predicted membrane-bound mannosyltransferase